MLDIILQTVSEKKAKPDENNLGFGIYYTDHMLMIDHEEGKGWHNARIVPYAPLSIDPAAMVLHYAMESFEGMKAYPTRSAGRRFYPSRQSAGRG